MGRSFYRPNSQNVIEDFKTNNHLSHAASGMEYTLIEREGRFYQRRSTPAPDGRSTNVLEEQVDYVVGSGNHARAYLHRTKLGRLVELPVSWYVEQSGYWAMTTGFDRADQPDMHGVIDAQCMACHNGYPRLQDAAAQDAAADNRFPNNLPEGIDCQRCHGPGRAHVEAANAPHPRKEVIRASIVNPAKLSRERQMDVCMQCHLETSSPHAVAEIRSYNRELFSFQPGQSLAEYKMFFERRPEPKADTFGNAHAAYGLRKSACYLQTQMTCLTCHNPHDVPHDDAAIQGYIGTCEKCHAKVQHAVALPPKENCITCHMPKRRTQGAVHLILTDHYIQRRRPPGDLLMPLHESTSAPANAPVTFYYPVPTQPTPEQQLYLAIAQVDDGDSTQGLAKLRALVEQQQPSAAEPFLEIARAYERRGNHPEAIAWFQQSLQRKSDFLPALREMPIAMLAAGQRSQALDVLKRGVALHPDDDVLLTELANASLAEGFVDEAGAVLRRALQADPERADAHNLAGLWALRRNDQRAAEDSFREALRLQPHLSEASNNLASLLIGQHRFPEAEYLYRRALQQDAKDVSAHHGLGLLLILQGSIAASLPELKAAVLLRPNSAPLHSDYADALAAQGLVQPAAAEYAEVLRLHPGQIDAELGLAMALLRQGRRLEAYPLLSQVVRSGDTNLSSIASQALQGGPIR
jgi:tetratricopeptide (TPR) repeat protein